MRSHLLSCNSIVSNYTGISETRTRLILLNYGLDGEITGWSSMVYGRGINCYYVNYATKTITYLFFLNQNPQTSFTLSISEKSVVQHHILPEGMNWTLDLGIFLYVWTAVLQSYKIFRSFRLKHKVPVQPGIGVPLNIIRS